MRRSVLQALATSALIAGGLGAQSVADSALRARVADALRAEGLVGVSWALITPESLRVGAAGPRDASLGTPLSPQDRVHVGSVTKALLATGILALVTDGRLSLEAEVAPLLPMLRIENPWAAEAPLRVRHLLDHTGGLDDARLRQVFTQRGDPDAPLRASVSADGRVRVRHRPGDRFSYSNTSYLLLGMVVEAVTGQRYEVWLDRQLLAPLGMTRSTFGFVSQRGRDADASLAMGHFDNAIPQDAYAIPVRPASQFTTTPEDMARFARFLMSDGRVGTRVLVRADLLRAMAVPTGTEAARAGLQAGYALGLMRRERWGIVGRCHLGNIGTFRAILCLYPSQQRAFFASYNSDPEAADFDRVDSLFAAELGVTPAEAAALAPIGLGPAEWNGWYLVRPNRFAQFAYLDALAGVTRVRWDGSSLTMRGTPGPVRVLDPVGGAQFRLQGRRTATHVLTTSREGVRVISDGLRTFERVSPLGVVLRWTGAALGLLGLLYVLLVGSVRVARALRRSTLRSEPLRWPVLLLWLMPIGGLLQLGQPALSIGDPTLANGVTAALTALLPVATALALAQGLRRGRGGSADVRDGVALAALLQWCLTLALAGLLPVALWR